MPAHRHPVARGSRRLAITAVLSLIGMVRLGAQAQPPAEPPAEPPAQPLGAPLAVFGGQRSVMDRDPQGVGIRRLPARIEGDGVAIEVDENGGRPVASGDGGSCHERRPGFKNCEFDGVRAPGSIPKPVSVT